MLVAACPSTLERFFEASIKEVADSEHLVIGDASNAGVIDPQQLRDFLMDAFSHSLATTLRNHKPEQHKIEADNLRWSMKSIPSPLPILGRLPNRRFLSSSSDSSPA